MDRIHREKTMEPIKPAHTSQDSETLSITTVRENEERPELTTHLSHTHDAPMTQYQSTVEVDDAVYNRIPIHRKTIIVALLSFCAFLSPISSTAVLAAVPEVAETYNTTGTIINLTNAVYMIFMGISPCFWGPLSQVYGRRWICISTACFFLAASIGTALSPNLVAFFIFRAITAFQGTAFLIVGASCIGDLYRPTERATAMGWFLSGTLIGPAFGPFIGGIIVTFTSWRVIFWVQTGLAGVAAVGAFFLLPETIHYRKAIELEGLPLSKRMRVLAGMINPWRVIRLFRYPNLLAAALASSSLVWNMYSLLTPIRYVLNPRFGLSSPIQSGLFYLAPGFGYLFGTFFGGRWADYTVKKWINKRGGVRIAEDRLRSCLPFLGIIIPGCVLIYGWSIEKEVGGVPLPVIMMFIQGVAQLFCFPSLNTYCLDVMQQQSAEVIAGNYMMRYLFAAMGTAFVLPAINKMGVGWFSTLSALFMVASCLLTCASVKWGKGWRDTINEKRRAASEERRNRKDVDEGDDAVERAEEEIQAHLSESIVEPSKEMRKEEV